MSTSNREEIPTALPGLEDENEREQLLQAENPSPDIMDPEDEDDDELEIQEPSKKSKRKRALKAVAGFMIFFIILFATVSWFFGIGVFSEDKPQPINRSAKSETQAPVSEDEKLKMALSMVAAREPSSSVDTSDTGSEPSVPVAPQSADQSSDVYTSSGYKGELPALDSITRPKSVDGDEERAALRTTNAFGQTPKQPGAETPPGVGQTAIAPKSGELSPGRSVFFGIERKSVSSPANRASYREEGKQKVDSETPSIPFGTLLPVRLTSALYTFRNSGGFVRMELTRPIEGKGYSYPAGTAVVGSLRGAESTRVFVTVTGLIDPASGQLIKLGGELLGRDGASGISGRKKKVTGVWSRLLRGLRETGSSIVSSIGSWRSGGTVVITDSMRRAGSDMPGLLNDKGNSSNSFVQVDAGSTGFVQITGLPEEVSRTTDTEARTESGLTDKELADLFSENSADKLRAALPRMTPEFRRLAEKALENTESR